MQPIKFNLGTVKIEPEYESLWFHAGRLYIRTDAAGWIKNTFNGYTAVTVELSSTWSCVILVESIDRNANIISWEYTAFSKAPRNVQIEVIND